jgi:hypothetical protein
MSHTKADLPRAKQAHDPWRHGEPSLRDVMTDEIVLLVMKRDGLTPDDVWPLVLDMGGCLQAPSGRKCTRQMTARAA